MFAWGTRLVMPVFVVSALAGCGSKSSLPSDQQALGEEITGLGGTYFVDKKDPDKGLFSIDLSGTKADDALVAKLENLPGLTHLKLNAAPVTNGAVASLKKMKNLVTLDIGNTKITQEGLDSLVAAIPNTEISWNVPDTPPPAEAGENPPTVE